MAHVIYVMGVSGCGKSTLARDLARSFGGRFLEGDSFHPPENVAAMAAGTPLTDDMRWPWLTALAGEAARLRDAGITSVTACSALRRSYRDHLRGIAGPMLFLHLAGPRSVISDRMQRRKNHYMPPALLDSQIATLEPPGADEPDCTTLSLSDPPPVILSQALAALARNGIAV